jgi:hypothetical protein
MDIHVKRGALGVSQALKEENENDNEMLTIWFPSREWPIDGRKGLRCRRPPLPAKIESRSLYQITLSFQSFQEMVGAKACHRF